MNLQRATSSYLAFSLSDFVLYPAIKKAPFPFDKKIAKIKKGIIIIRLTIPAAIDFTPYFFVIIIIRANGIIGFKTLRKSIAVRKDRIKISKDFTLRKIPDSLKPFLNNWQVDFIL